MNANLRIGGATLNQIPMDWDNNLRNIKKAIEDAKKAKVKILCLPELCLTGYGCEDVFLSDWLPKKALEKLSTIVPLCEDIMVIVGLPFRYSSILYNTACVIADQKIIGIYAKHHLANDGVHYEPRWFHSWPQNKIAEISIGDKKVPFGAIRVTYHGVNIAFEICEDAWRTDRPAKNLRANPAQIILNPSASHFAFGKADFRKRLVKESSEEFNCTYLYTNLLGNEAGRMIFDGDIMIAQNGKMLAQNKRLSFQEVNLLYTDIDFSNAANSTSQEGDDYQGNLEEFGRAASLALFDYMRKSRSKGFVLSLSGGADSSSIAVLVAEMVRNGLKELGVQEFLKKLHWKNDDILKIKSIESEVDQRRIIIKAIFHTAYQASQNSSQDTFNSAEKLAESIGAEFSHWHIDDNVARYTQQIETALNRKLTWEEDDIALQNIQARARSPIIWMLANVHNRLLLTTSNRSEGDVGYTTMDGDTSGSISPIAAVDKHFILQWLKYAEKTLGYEGLNYVNQLSPSAELRPQDQTQTDEKDLMPYELLVAIEKLAIRDRKSPLEVFHQLNNKDQMSSRELVLAIEKFFKLWSNNQWKRERLAPAFHLDDFNIDPKTWCRFPILSSGFSEELIELRSILNINE